MYIEDKTLWLVNPDVLDIRTLEGLLLLDFERDMYSEMAILCAAVWLLVKWTPAGITVKQIVDLLEMVVPIRKNILASETCDAVAEMARQGWVRSKSPISDHSEVKTGGSEDQIGVRVFEFELQSRTAHIDNQPFVQRLGTLQSFIDQLFPQGVQNGLDWRANKLRDAIDNAPGKAIETLRSVCSQLQLSLSDRQARRLFKEAAGISMKEYARKRRLIFAAKQLQATEEPIKLVATEAGYRTYHGFRKAFCEMFQLTPAEFRKFWQRPHVAA